MQLPAPRQSFFAVILVISWLITSALVVSNTLSNQQNQYRSVANVVATQLAQSVADYVAADDRVGMAVLVKRAAQLPVVNVVTIVSNEEALLAHASKKKNTIATSVTFVVKSTEKTIVKHISKDTTKIAYLNVGVAQVSLGTVFTSSLWLLVLLALLHAVIFVLYTIVARQFLYNELLMQHAGSTQPQPRKAATAEQDESLVSKVKNIFTRSEKNKPEEKAKPKVHNKEENICVHISFDDKDNRLALLSPNTKQEYFEECSIIVQSALEVFEENNITPSDIEVVYSGCDKDGIQIELNGDDLSDCAYDAFVIAQLLITTFAHIYKTQTAHDNFAMQAIGFISHGRYIEDVQDCMEIKALANAIYLLLEDNACTVLSSKISPSPLENPLSDLQTKIARVDAVQQQLISDIREMEKKVIEKIVNF